MSEEHTLSDAPRVAPSSLERCGRIRFSAESWEGPMSNGVDFPMMLGAIGLVPVEVGRMDLRTRQIEVLYRWVGFPVLREDTMPTYQVTLGCSRQFLNGAESLEIDRITLTCDSPVEGRVIRVGLLSGQWVIHPTEEEWRLLNGGIRDTPRQGQSVPAEPRISVPQRRIVIR